ncbi:MAG: fumarylacetoacetate hydrolase family protein [Bacteroidetes bacterium]|nr:fumarylacetoacetate hydrolase family protein [Bacteroidota bacterium]
MKLICLPVQSPHFYLKPDTALLRNGRCFYLPDHCPRISGSLALVVRITRLGRHIAPQFAPRYYHETALGFCLYATDLLEQNSAAGASWAPACALDYSAPLSDIFDPLQEEEVFAWKEWQGGLNRSIDQSIADISRSISLRMGDLIWIELHPPTPLLVPSQIVASRNGALRLHFSLH